MEEENQESKVRKPSLKEMGKAADAELISPVAGVASDLLHRTEFLRLIGKELDRTGTPEQINDAINISPLLYQMVVWSYDMVVIEFASLAKNLVAKGGVLGRLNSYSPALQPQNWKKLETSGVLYLNSNNDPPEQAAWLTRKMEERNRKDLDKAIRSRVRMLFPAAAQREGYRIQLPDIQALRDDVDAIVQSVEDDRNNHRAHMHQGPPKPGVERLPLLKLKRKLQWLLVVVHALRFIVSKGTWTAPRVLGSNTENLAKDIADLISHASIAHLNVKLGLMEGPHVDWSRWAELRAARYELRKAGGK